MVFTKFHSIENSYRKKTVAFFSEACPDEEWCVTEKVHGCNFSFTMRKKEHDEKLDNDDSLVEILPGKRSAFLPSEKDRKNFNGSDQVLKHLRPKLEKLFDIVSGKCSCTKMVVYGELFGGNWPGHKGRKIQKGVYYTPGVEFIVFDILVLQEKNVPFYMNYDHTTDILRYVEMLHCPIIFRGKLDQCLKWSNEHKEDNSIIPYILGLDETKLGTNAREGHVLKPLNSRFLDNGVRVILKDKGDKFKEKSSDGKYGNAPQPELSPEQKDILEEASKYVTESRLDNVCSKENLLPNGGIPRESIGVMIRNFVQDALEDFLKDYNHQLTASEKAFVEKNIKKFCRVLVMKRT